MRYMSMVRTTDGGDSWTLYKKIFDSPIPNTWDSAQIFDDFAFYYNGLFYFFYAGSSKFGNAQNLSAQIGLATIEWTEPIQPPAPKIESPDIVIRGAPIYPKKYFSLIEKHNKTIRPNTKLRKLKWNKH
jgi:hypothetical protein